MGAGNDSVAGFRRRRRRRWLASVLAVLVVALVGGTLAHLAAARAVDRAIEDSARPGPSLAVEELPGHRPAFAERGAPRLWTDTGRARDGAEVEGQLVVATAGGLVELAPSAGSARVTTALEGLADHDLTAAAVLGGTVWLGTRSGLLAAVERGRPRAVRLARGSLGAVVDLAFHGRALYVATASGVLVRLEDGRATAVGPEVQGGLAAIAIGPSGPTVAGGDGGVYRVVADERLERIAETGERGRATALGWDGDRLFVGTPTGLLAGRAGSELAEVRADLFVTSVLVEGGRLLVATIDDGVLVLDPTRPGSGPVRHELRGRRVDRLRSLGGRPHAFGPGLAASLAEGRAVAAPSLPRGIASGQVTALALDGRGRTWVGHFDDGVDVLAASGEVERHLPEPGDEVLSSVNAIALDEASGAMLVATSHGVLEVGDDRVRVLDRADGLIGDSVTALLVSGGERAYATSRGLSVSTGAAVRSLYAFHGLPSNRTYALAGTPDRLQVGTLGGLAFVEGLRVVRVLRAGPGGLAASFCAALAQAPEGLYVGTAGGGVDLVLPDGTVRRLPPPGGGRMTVNFGAMLVLGDLLLVGTLERGLLVYDRRRQAWTDQGGGPLPDASVSALAADDDHLYIGTDRGLLRLLRSAFPGER